MSYCRTGRRCLSLDLEPALATLMKAKMQSGMRWAALDTGISLSCCVLEQYGYKKNPNVSKAFLLSASKHRHIDTARMYEVEPAIGKALASLDIPREELWITSKLDNCDHAPERVGEVCREQLKDLQTDYLDLYLIHWPVTGKGGQHLDPPIKVIAYSGCQPSRLAATCSRQSNLLIQARDFRMVNLSFCSAGDLGSYGGKVSMACACAWPNISSGFRLRM